MDRQQATAPEEAFLAAPVIERAPVQAPKTTEETFVSAEPSHILNILLSAAWVGFLAYIVSLTPNPAAESAPVVLEGLANVLGPLTAVGIYGTIVLAIKNSAKTAPLSIAIALGITGMGALCGLAGHSASTWLPQIAFSAVVAAASVAVFARRA